MLTKIRLENFRNWQKLDLDLSNINILFGTNSSGKTSILDALLLLKQTATGFDRYQPINLGGGDATDLVDLGSYGDLVFKHDETQQIGIALEWLPRERVMAIPRKKKGAKVDLITYSVQWATINGNARIVNLAYSARTRSSVPLSLDLYWDGDLGYHYQFYYTGMGKEVASQLSVSDLPEPIEIESCYAISPNLFAAHAIGVDPTPFNRAFEQIVSSVNYLGPLRDHPKRNYLWRGTAPYKIGTKGEKTIEVLLAAERTANTATIQNVAKWLVKMGLVTKFKIDSLDKRYYEPRVTMNQNQTESSLIDIGFGVSQVLPVITLLFFAPEGSTILIEQPEIHLHPSAQAILADLFLEVAEKRNLQLIIESHSEHLLRRLQRRIAERKSEFASPEHIKTYFCKPTPEGSIAEPVNVDSYGRISNWPENFFGDIETDMEAMIEAGLERRRQELTENA